MHQVLLQAAMMVGEDDLHLVSEVLSTHVATLVFTKMWLSSYARNLVLMFFPAVSHYWAHG